MKTQLETGELKVEDLVKSGKEKSLETFEQIKEKIAEKNLSTADILDAIKAKTAKAPTVDVTADDIEDAVVVSEDIEIDIDSVVVEPTVKEVTEAPTNDSEESHNL